MKNFLLKLKGLRFSKTFWLNAVAIILALLNETALGGMIPAKTELEIIAVLNIINRFLTNGSLAVK